MYGKLYECNRLRFTFTQCQWHFRLTLMIQSLFTHLRPELGFDPNTINVIASVWICRAVCRNIVFCCCCFFFYYYGGYCNAECIATTAPHHWFEHQIKTYSNVIVILVAVRHVSVRPRLYNEPSSLLNGNTHRVLFSIVHKPLVVLVFFLLLLLLFISF